MPSGAITLKIALPTILILSTASRTPAAEGRSKTGQLGSCIGSTALRAGWAGPATAASSISPAAQGRNGPDSSRKTSIASDSPGKRLVLKIYQIEEHQR